MAKDNDFDDVPEIPRELKSVEPPDEPPATPPQGPLSTLRTNLGLPPPVSPTPLTDMARRVVEKQARFMENIQKEEDQRTSQRYDLMKQQHDRTMEENAAYERILPAQERLAAANERMLPVHERIALANRENAQLQLEMLKMQQPYRDKLDEVYLASMCADQERVEETFKTMFNQTQSAGRMFWITFLLGVGLIVAAVSTFVARPGVNNPLVVAFFGSGALSILSFFIRDPSQRLQRAGGKLVQLQVAWRYHLMQSQYWANYFNNETAMGQQVMTEEIEEKVRKRTLCRRRPSQTRIQPNRRQSPRPLWRSRPSAPIAPAERAQATRRRARIFRLFTTFAL